MLLLKVFEDQKYEYSSIYFISLSNFCFCFCFCGLIQIPNPFSPN